MGLRTVQMKTTSAGPNGNYLPGQVIQVDEERARVLVEGGYADYMDEPVKAVMETASVEPLETAAMYKVQRRKAGK